MQLNYTKIKEKEWCIRHYVELKKSVKQIRRETGLGVNTIKRWLKKHNIPIRQGDHKIVLKQKASCKGKFGPKHHNWRPYCTNATGYIFAYAPNHPNANKQGRVFKHRLVIEEQLGYVLEPDEFVHHIDMNKTNNNINNLFLCKRGQHRKSHASLSRLCAELLKRNVIYFNREEARYGLR